MDFTRGVCNGMSKRLLPVEEAGVVRTVDVSTMFDRRIDGKLWHVHHKFQFESYSESGEVRSLVELTGTFRHNSCSIAYDAHELQGSVCSLCRGIVNLDDFRHGVRRLGELGQQGPEGFNDRYMSHQEALSKLSELEARQSKARRERTWHIFKICALTSRVKTLQREKAAESCKRGDVRRLIDDLQYCAAQGKVERKQEVLFNFISDAVRSVRLREGPKRHLENQKCQSKRQRHVPFLVAQHKSTSPKPLFPEISETRNNGRRWRSR